jgi:peptidoglycan/LPS O-acetylase OafA/YrhL
MSFPVYLVQVSVICSLGCLVYVQSLGFGELTASLLACAASIAGSLFAALPIMALERAWIERLNGVVAMLQRRIRPS